MRLVIILVKNEEDLRKDEEFGEYIKRMRKKYAELNKTNRVIIIV